MIWNLQQPRPDALFRYASCIPTREAAERIAAIYEEVMP